MNAERRIVKFLRDYYKKTIELYPDLYMAPTVPNERILAMYHTGKELPESLLEHLRSDPACRILTNSAVFFSDPFPGFTEEELHEVDDYSRTPNIKSIKSGDLCSTETELFDCDGNVHYTFSPQKIIVADNGYETPWGDIVYRCVPVTDTGLNESHTNFDIEIGNNWVAHTWLSFPVSVEQIREKIETVREADLNIVIEKMKKYEDEGELSQYKIGERRTFDRASFLSYIADALLERSEKFGESDM